MVVIDACLVRVVAFVAGESDYELVAKMECPFSLCMLIIGYG